MKGRSNSSVAGVGHADFSMLDPLTFGNTSLLGRTAPQDIAKFVRFENASDVGNQVSSVVRNIR